MAYVGEIRARADREILHARCSEGDCTEDGQIRISSHTHGRRFAVTWTVTTTESVPSREDHPHQTENKYPPPTQKTHQSAKHLPETATFLGGFSLLVQIEEKSPGVCADA